MEPMVAAGYRSEQAMELLLGIALKTISNYLDTSPRACRSGIRG